MKPLELASPVLLLVLTSALAGCSLFGGGDGGLAPITGDLRVAVTEQIHDGLALGGTADPRLELRVQSDERYDCDGGSLVTRFERRGEQLRLAVRGRSIPDGICIHSVGPATARVDLDLPAGTYTLALEARGRTDRYTLEITPDVIRLTPVEVAVSEPEYEAARRVPEHSFGLYCSGRAADAEAPCAELIAELRSAADLEEVTPPEEGFWPYPLYPLDSALLSPRFFRARTAEDLEAAQRRIADYPAPTGASIYAITWRGGIVDADQGR